MADPRKKDRGDRHSLEIGTGIRTMLSNDPGLLIIFRLPDFRMWPRFSHDANQSLMFL